MSLVLGSATSGNFPVNVDRYYYTMCCLYEIVGSQKAPEKESIMYGVPNTMVLVAVELVTQRRVNRGQGTMGKHSMLSCRVLHWL